jgi:hypothetical protein
MMLSLPAAALETKIAPSVKDTVCEMDTVFDGRELLSNISVAAEFEARKSLLTLVFLFAVRVLVAKNALSVTGLSAWMKPDESVLAQAVPSTTA